MEMFDTGARIAVLENEVRNIATDVKEMMVDQKEQHQALMSKFNSIERRITDLEKWRWTVVGGAAVIGYLASTFLK